MSTQAGTKWRVVTSVGGGGLGGKQRELYKPVSVPTPTVLLLISFESYLMSIVSPAHLPGRRCYTSMVGTGHSRGACRVHGLFAGVGTAALDSPASLCQ